MASKQSLNWTVILPAAGRGSRLGFQGPKILCPVAGKTILDHLLSRFKSYLVLLVVAPDSTIEYDGLSVVQAAPIGMADAVACALAYVVTDYVCVCWGDQIVTSDTLIERGMKSVEVYKSDAVCPVYLAQQPYIALQLEEGRISKVLQRREGAWMPEQGISDLGLFFFRTEALREKMEGFSSIGAVTGEQNFVPILPLFERSSLILGKKQDVLGINTPLDVTTAEEILKSLCA